MLATPPHPSPLARTTRADNPLHTAPDRQPYSPNLLPVSKSVPDLLPARTSTARALLSRSYSVADALRLLLSGLRSSPRCRSHTPDFARCQSDPDCFYFHSQLLLSPGPNSARALPALLSSLAATPAFTAPARLHQPA